MPATFICCHGCEFKGFMQYQSITLRYENAAGQFAYSHRVFGWCHTCVGVRSIEAPLDANALQSEIAALRASNRGLLKRALNRILGGDHNVALPKLLELEALLNVALTRRSKPRCLTCSNSTTEALFFDAEGKSEGFIHGCGSHLYTLPVDPKAPRFAFRPEVVRLDFEGRRI